MTGKAENGVTLDEYVSVAERFHRSVHLSKDWESGAGFRDYLVTPTAEQLSKRVLREVEDEAGNRAWSLVGPYGAGKSAYALFLAQLLSGGDSRHPEVDRIRGEEDFSRPAFVPVLLVADRSPLEARIAAGIADAFEELSPDVAEKADALSSQDEITGDELSALITEAAAAAEDTGRGGLLLVVDEFGKFLEYAAAKPDERDLLFLQTIAESVDRCEVPVLFFTILHQGFSDYLPSRDEIHRREWQKVQGRFREVAFQLPVEQLLTLVGKAIETDLPEEIGSRWSEEVEKAVQSSALERVQKRVPVEEVLPYTVPLNPVAALLLSPLFRGKLAQNERSLFAFLTAKEAFGFPDYLETSEWTGGSAPDLYSVDKLYDYVNHALALGAFRGEQGRRWAEIERCLGRLPAEAGGTAERLVKAIGLISTYGPQIGLDASAETLEHALPDGEEQIREGLSLLTDRSIAVFRRHKNAYGLWEGSDVDLEAAYEKAQRETGQASLAQRLEEHVELQPVVARAHYVQSGTLRYFDVQIIDAEQEALQEAFEAEKEGADGRVVFVVGLDDSSREEFLAAAKDLTAGEGGDRLRLVAVPDEVVRLDDALRQLEAWRWVRNNVSKLQGDEAARREVEARISHARDVIGEKAGQVFGLAGHSFRPELSEWIQDGEIQPRRTGREFQRWISRLCDEVFHLAPELHNELLNRQSLSSASSAARRNLIEQMMANEEEARLGIEGTPAEASMYVSMLRAGDFHEEREPGRWELGEPNANWRPVWSFLEDYFESTARQRRVVVELFDRLQEPPYGLKKGPIPVVFVAFVRTHQDEIAFYEDGVYVPEVTIEVVERLLARPETFEVQSYALEDQQREVLDALADKVVSPHSGEKLEAELLPIVRSLVRQAAELNEFTKNTDRLDPPEAIDVRDALLEATSPLDLLFEDLPEALGVRLQEPEDVEDFADKLRDCMVAIHRAYPALLDQIETALRNAFDLPDGPAVRAVSSLKRRAQPLVDYALEDKLQVFVREAARLGNQRDWREVLGRVVQGGMPPHAWSDKDVASFQVKLRQVAGSFQRLEELVAETDGKTPGAVYRLGVLREQFEERRATVSVDEDIEPAVSDLASRLLEEISRYSSENGNGKRVSVAALAEVSESLLPASDVEEETDE